MAPPHEQQDWVDGPMTPQQQPHPLDAQAQALGFPDYASYAAWDAQRQAGLKVRVDRGTPTTPQQQNHLAQPAQQGPGSIAPGTLWGWIADKFGQATGN